MNRIILRVHRNATDVQIRRFLRILEDSETVSGAEYVEYPEDRSGRFTTEQAQAREKVWSASKEGSAVYLTADETAALWQSILSDSVMRVR